ncbi:MAG: helix-turn-helix domain-containing protein, partial [Prevotella sp.]|nr:helix-turn-helix domain-containing protein [Prevotella sp.]
GTKKKDIAKAINVSPSTISREIKRNSGHNGHYNWETAQRNVVYRKRISIPNRISISERPVEADSRRFGDFEMDTIVGKNGHGAIVTLTERSTNMLFMRKLNKGKNVNGLIRQYIPKNTCFSNISQQQITKIMQKINTRPREKLNFSTPNECFYKKML